MQKYLSPLIVVRVAVAVILLAGLLAVGCAQPSETPATPAPPDDASVSRDITAKATVVSVDRGARLLTLKDKDANEWTVRVPPEVRNLDQIQAGDSVAVRYQESMAVSLVKPGEAISPTSASVTATRAEPGQTPGASLGAQITATVRVDSVDTKKNIVVFTPLGGSKCTVNVVRPEGQRFIQGLKPGDQVEITYTQAVALSVEKQ